MTDAVTLATVDAWLRRFAAETAEQAAWLTELDSAIGDADHGTNLARGMAAVVEKLDAAPPADIPALLKAVGMTLISKVGGASGSLYGSFFLEAGKAAAGADDLDGRALEAALRAGVGSIVARGKAEPGDKTMLDALLPAVDALQAALTSGSALGDAVSAASDAAAAGRDATEPLVARKGRASYLGERSAGHLDPGAASSAILVKTLADTVTAA
ncbi:dihydroxyacetone kinase subunit L [Microbacterium sp. MEC084]|jgi:dihydroxyacetone kinase-like protein|uniref:dihydroxyacetone kinase subunit DhaL n=1 Tax=unclassified Microbacterium TaxID=2609290 RepID=UPI0006FF34D1|nr:MULTISPECIES: dihydroxyacetone kinase subunit DhaL [unclassified Microbacterium]KQZ11841.1 dihydroxyacetone kinase [Microbacterium sp. Root53]MCD1268017.1 dihydroxyacetone kinase subunit L [Microbacterium sp. MEC084]